jgi:hypothetical protein
VPLKPRRDEQSFNWTETSEPPWSYRRPAVRLAQWGENRNFPIPEAEFHAALGLTGTWTREETALPSFSN